MYQLAKGTDACAQSKRITHKTMEKTENINRLDLKNAPEEDFINTMLLLTKELLTESLYHKHRAGSAAKRHLPGVRWIGGRISAESGVILRQQHRFCVNRIIIPYGVTSL